MKYLNSVKPTVRKNKFLQYGLPFLILVVGGSFALREFTSIRYKYSKKQTVTPEEVEKLGVKMKDAKEVTLDSEFEKIKKLDIENWENKRGPRPWEEQT
ncbi:cytochrome c oxidase assembly protein COX16 homolog, mitochondrial [Condylostylus longicornis]|uniref:cytochrome c oxidase assembly protein COX16 homolog, mitochondrial n=1 Tax=Condylostylus longicornis TaxID=2530218 RepID=UPI00244E5A63|nr:cytochrome c oxidase assembly protein COX16 homolog, mitochondrial [Condylostylus longicornis]